MQAKSENEKRELKGKLPPFSTFFFFSMVFFFFCLKIKRCQEKGFETKGQKWEGKKRSQK